VNFAVSTDALRLFLASSGQSMLPSFRGQNLPLADIGAIARAYTLHVTCWR
jgi:cell envelope opacity-associated protein A